MSPAELLDLCARETWVSVDVAAEIIGIGHTLAYDRARDTGFLDLDRIVPVRKVSDRRWKVPTSALLRWAGLEDSPLGPGLTQGGGTARDGPASGAVPRLDLVGRHPTTDPQATSARRETRWSNQG